MNWVLRVVAVVGVLLAGCTGAGESSSENESEVGPFVDGFVITSPSGELRVELGSDEVGRPRYRALRAGADGDELVISDSTLGLEVTLDDTPISYAEGGELEADGGSELVSSTFSLPTGKARVDKIEAMQQSFLFRPGAPSTTDIPLTIDIWVSDTGFAFRYGLASASADRSTEVRIEWERSSFRFSPNAQAWLQEQDAPGFVTPAYERLWSGEATAGLPGRAEYGWNFPALFATDTSWSLLTESAPGVGDAGSHISNVTDSGEFFLDFPHRAEGNGFGESAPVVNLPWTSPWRIVMNSPNLDGIVESNVVRHLSPESDGNFDWVEPGSVSWSWWSDHDSSRDAEAIEPFIDLAARMGWEYSLVDANWTEFGEERLAGLVDYGADQNVGLFVWYNSGGPNNAVTEAPRDRMFDADVRQAEFARLREMGVVGVKVDFFHSDKPESIARYRGILRDAADAGLLVNFHGATVPRGWSREFPNLMTVEAVRGAEIYTFDSAYAALAPRQNTVLPFTRNVVGSMDYTPVILGDTVRRLTRNGHELALAVVFESGLLHLIDTPEAYLGQPDAVIEMLSTVPSAWDETKLLAGSPGSHAVVARRHGDTWWIGGISAQDNELSVRVDLDRLRGAQIGDPPDSLAELVMVCDNPEWDDQPGRPTTWDDPQQYLIERGPISDTVTLSLVENGGCLIRLGVADSSS